MTKFRRYGAMASVGALQLLACGGSLPARSATLDPANPDGPESPPLSGSLFATDSVASLQGESAHREASSGEEHAKHHHAAAPEHAAHGATPAAQQPGESSDSAAVYTCPMHPEVTSPVPGKCPKCGMKLVPKKGAQ